MDASGQGLQALKNTFVCPEGPVMPKALQLFIDNYKTQRATFKKNNSAPKPGPKR
jgi:hypothetical protein